MLYKNNTIHYTMVHTKTIIIHKGHLFYYAIQEEFFNVG